MYFNFRSLFPLGRFGNKYTNVTWIRNCSSYSDPVTSDALGGLAGSMRMLCCTRRLH